MIDKIQGHDIGKLIRIFKKMKIEGEEATQRLNRMAGITTSGVPKEKWSSFKIEAKKKRLKKL